MREKPKVSEKISIPEELENYKKSKFRKILSKIQDLDKNNLLFRIKERGLDVVSCGLGTNQSASNKDITERKGVSGLLNFYPRWYGSNQGTKKINKNEETETDEQEQGQKSARVILKDEFLVSEAMLLEKYVKDHQNNLELFFEKGRLNQMLRDSSTDSVATEQFQEGASQHFYHNCTSESIKLKLSQLFHAKQESKDYSEVLNLFQNTFYHRGLFSSYSNSKCDLSLLRFYYICLDIYPGFRELVFQRIHNLLTFISQENLLEDFGDKFLKIVNTLARAKEIYKTKTTSISPQSTEPNLKSRGVQLETQFIKFDPQLSLEKELLIYLITELDTSSIQFTAALKIMEQMLKLGLDQLHKKPTSFDNQQGDEHTGTGSIAVDHSNFLSIGLFLGDLYSEKILGLCKVDLEERIRYYNLSKKSSVQVIKESSVDRLLNLYYKVYIAQKESFANQPTENLQQISVQSLKKLYKKVLSYASYLKNCKSLSVFSFYFQYYLKGENYESQAELPPKKAVRNIDNVLIARQLNLTKALDYIRPFYIFGDPSSFKVSFEILKFLKIDECFTVSLKMNHLRLCMEYAYCLEKGIKHPVDLEFAVEIYKHILKESLINDDRIKLAKVLTRFARILERRNEVEQMDMTGLQISANSSSLRSVLTQDKSQILFMNSIFALIEKMSPGQVTKPELYLLGSILTRLSKYPGPMKNQAIETFKICYKLPCLTELDYVLNYKIESKLKTLIRSFGPVGEEPRELEYIKVNCQFEPGVSRQQQFGLYDKVTALIKELRETLTLPSSFDLDRVTSYVKDLSASLKQEKIDSINQLSEQEKERETIQRQEFKNQIQNKVTRTQVAVSDSEKIYQTILRRVSSSRNIRVFSKSQLDFEFKGADYIQYIGGVRIGRCQIKDNYQVLRFFELTYDTLKEDPETGFTNVDHLLNNLRYMELFNPLFVCYYGVQLELEDTWLEKDNPGAPITSNFLETNQQTNDRKKLQKVVKLRILCDDFEELGSNPHASFWMPNQNKIDDLVKAMYRLTMSLASLHTIGKPFHLLIPHHLAINSKREIKLILPFFMDFFQFPRQIFSYREIDWNLQVYFSTEVLRVLHHSSELGDEGKKLRPDFITEEGCLKDLMTQNYTPVQCEYLSADIYSLGMIFINILTASPIYPENFFTGKLKIIDHLVPPNKGKPKKLRSVLKKKIELIKGQFSFLTPLILSMVSHLPKERPNIFKLKFKLEKVLFNYNFQMIGISRLEMYRSFYTCISFNDSLKSRTERRGIMQQSKEKAEEELEDFQANNEENLLPKKNTTSDKIVFDSLIYLPKTLKFFGNLDEQKVPQGQGRILNIADEDVIEGQFEQGMPDGKVIFHFTHSQKLHFELEDGYPIKGEYDKEQFGRSYTVKFNHFQPNSWMLETEKVSKKIESILNHSEIGLGIDSIKRTSLLDAFTRSFTKQQLKLNVYNSEMMIKFLEFFPTVNKVSTVKEKIREKNLYDSDDSLDEYDLKEIKKSQKQLETHFTSLFDPFGNLIRMAEQTLEQYMTKYFKPRSKSGFSDDEKMGFKNCIMFSYDHGISMTSIEYDKVLKTVLYNPKISKNCIFIGKINTYALGKTSSQNSKDQQGTQNFSGDLPQENQNISVNQFKQLDAKALEEKFHEQQESSAFDQSQKGSKFKSLLQKVGKKKDDSRSLTTITQNMKQKKEPVPSNEEENWQIEVQKQVEEGQPLTDYSNLLFYLSEICFDKSIVLDLIGNYFRGKVENGNISTGILVLKNSSKIELKSGKEDQFYGLIEKENLTYAGQIAKLKREGYGRLVKDGKCIYEGEFFDDQPHGKGVLFDFVTQELFFKGLFRKGKKHYGIQFSKDWILKGLFLPIKEEKETYGIRLDFYNFNTTHNNFIFDGNILKDYVGTQQPLSIKTKLFPQESTNLVNLDRTPRGSELNQLSVLISGPCKVEYEDFDGSYIGKFKDGKKSGKGILIDNKGNKMMAIWSQGSVVGKLLWNRNLVNGQFGWTSSIQGSTFKLKSNLKIGSFDNQNKRGQLETAGVAQSLIMSENDDDLQQTFNHYHPHRAISSKKSPSGKITKISAEGQFVFSEDGVLVQSGVGKLILSDGSFYQGIFSQNLFDQYGKLLFQDGSYYKGQFEKGFYHGYGELYNSFTETLVRGQFKSGKPDGAGFIYIWKSSEEEQTKKPYTHDEIVALASSLRISDFYPCQFDQGKISCVLFTKEKLKECLIEHGNKVNDVEIESALSSVILRSVENKFALNGTMQALLNNGSVFEGQIFQNRINGLGVVLKDKSKVEQTIDSSRLRPQELVSLMNIPTINAQELYRGEFENGYSQGLGMRIIEGSRSYSGLFFEGKEHGFGTWKRRQHWKHCVSKNGKIDGVVIHQQNNKVVQTSEYKTGKLHGYTVVKNDLLLSQDQKLLQFFAEDELKFQTELEDFEGEGSRESSSLIDQTITKLQLNQ